MQDIDLGGLSEEVTLDAEKMNDGVWIQLFTPSADEETGQPVPMRNKQNPDLLQRAKVRHHRCKMVKDLEKARQKEGFVKVRVAKRKERDGVIADTSMPPEEDRFGCFLAALENFGSKGGVQDLTFEQARNLFGNTALEDIIQQITETAFDDESFLAGAGTSEGNGSAPSAEKTMTATPAPETAEATA